MRITLSARSRVLVGALFIGTWTVLGLACSAEDENPATTRNRGTDGGADTSTTTPEADGSVQGGPYCEKLGGAGGVGILAKKMIDSAAVDCRIASQFEELNDRVYDCWRIFVQSNVQCPGIKYEQGTTTDERKEPRKCESVLPGVELSSLDYTLWADFNNPESVVRSVLETAGLTVDELRAVGPAFNGKRDTIVDEDRPRNKYTECKPNCTQAKGEECIRLIPDGGNPPKDAGNDTSTPPQDSGSDPDTGATDQ